MNHARRLGKAKPAGPLKQSTCVRRVTKATDKQGTHWAKESKLQTRDMLHMNLESWRIYDLCFVHNQLSICMCCNIFLIWNENCYTNQMFLLARDIIQFYSILYIQQVLWKQAYKKIYFTFALIIPVITGIGAVIMYNVALPSNRNAPKAKT